MSFNGFNTFCNICFIKERIIKLCMEENESIFHILISSTSSPDIVNGIIYLCVNCYNKLEEYNKIRELFLTNFVRFRYLYNEHKKQLEKQNAPDIEKQLKAFVNANVERPSGTPLIENYEVVQGLKNNMDSNLDICKESDGEFIQRYSHELLNKNDLSHAHTSFNPESNISENDTNICHVKYENDSFNEDRENIHGNSVYIKEERNRDRFEESQDPLVSDTVVNVTPHHESGDDDISDVSFNPEHSETGPTDIENKTSDTVCKVCDEMFSCKSDLEEHICARTGKKHYICDKCKKIFTDIGRFRSHNRFHSDEKPYKCDECGLGFTQQSDLKRHKFRHTGKKPYSCDECQKTFIENFELMIHKRTHSGVKPYKCDECGLGFTQQANLNAHRRIHTGEKPYKCDECSMGFRQVSILKRHKLTHTGERPYSCDVCQKKFRESGALTTHKRIHSGEKPYKCDECGMEFAQASNIRRHKFTHTSERPYSCDECNKTFKHNYKLTKHKQTHNRERRYKCDECSSKFNSASDLKKHKRTHTG